MIKTLCIVSLFFASISQTGRAGPVNEGYLSVQDNPNVSELKQSVDTYDYIMTGIPLMTQEMTTTKDSRHPYVYKIFKQIEWNAFQNAGEFFGSAHDIRDGFIHLASGDQVEFVISNYFTNEKVVYIAKFVTADLGDHLKWESNSSEELYPHLYKVPLCLEGIKSYERRVLNYH